MLRAFNAAVVAALVLTMIATTTESIALAEPDFTLTNGSNFLLTEIYASPSDEEAWDEELLWGDALQAGASMDVSLAGGACSYDFYIVAADGWDGYVWGVDLCSSSDFVFELSPAGTRDRD